MRHLAPWLALLVACAPGAGQTDESMGDRPAQTEPPSRVADAFTDAAPAYLARYDFEAGGRSHDLPGRLDEISGLAVSTDGRLFAHDDEEGRIYEIDPATGDVGKRIDLGSGEIRNDFEGIATVGDRFFVVSSDGFLYEFREGGDEENVAYRATDTGLGDGCEIEGLDYDPAVDALLFACKRTDAYRDFVVIHRMPLGDEGGERIAAAGAPMPGAEAPAHERLAPILIPRADLPAHGLEPDFQPGAVMTTPAGTLILTSAAPEAIIEVDGEGRILGGVALSPERHPQAEGLALGPDGSLLIADEKNDNDAARLTRYTPRGDEDR